MEDYILAMLIEQFKEDGEIISRVGKDIYNPDTKEILKNCSYILLNDIGLIYYNHLYKECFYHGCFPGRNFFEIRHFRMKRDFRPLLPFAVERLLIESFEQKTPKKLVFSKELEIQFFNL